MTKSESLFNEAVNFIPGGVNSPVRAFGSIGEAPRFIERADGAYMTDVDGNKYLDYVCSWGPMILGHNHPEILKSVLGACKDGLSFGAATRKEVEMAELICEIVKFTGCYHGHSDAMLVKAGSGVMTSGVPDSAGVPAGCTEDTLSAIYNDLESVKALFQELGKDIAAIIVEPVGANMGVVPPSEGFLKGLRELCDKYGSLLIFDEVITGFRLALDGAQGFFGVKPDLTTFGKIIGAGMPVGAYGGRKEIMEMVSPVGAVYQAGTLSGNPVAMAAGLAQLHILKDHPEIYTNLNAMGDWFYTEIDNILKETNANCTINHVGSLGCVFFTENPVDNYASAKTSDTAEFARYCKYMMGHGIYLAPSQFEAMFLSAAHTKPELEQTLEIIKAYFAG